MSMNFLEPQLQSLPHLQELPQGQSEFPQPDMMEIEIEFTKRELKEIN
jgi:hypothetical protein